LVTNLHLQYFDYPIRISPYVSDEIQLLDTAITQIRVLRGDSIWTTCEGNHRFQGNFVSGYLGNPFFNCNPYREQWEVARIRLEGTLRLFKIVLPIPLPEKEIGVIYRRKPT
jgi:hypothetical protein